MPAPVTRTWSTFATVSAVAVSPAAMTPNVAPALTGAEPAIAVHASPSAEYAAVMAEPSETRRRWIVEGKSPATSVWPCHVRDPPVSVWNSRKRAPFWFFVNASLVYSSSVTWTRSPACCQCRASGTSILASSVHAPAGAG